VTKGMADSEEYTICSDGRWPMVIRMKVRECSAYEDKRNPTLSAMAEIAWPVAVDKKGKRAGFLSPDEFQKRAKDEDLRLAGGTLIDPLTGERVY